MIIMSNKSINRRKNEKLSAWNNARKCTCGSEECEVKHRICSICFERMHFDVWVYEDSDLPHSLAWNKDHVREKSNGGTNAKNNLIATHPWCNNDRSNKPNEIW